jgi:DNA-binding transcriptional ArsR family regulator
MDIFAVVADPTRRTMLEMMIPGERAAGDFVSAFPNVSQPAISQHLKVLRDTGLVSVRAERQRRFYTLEPAGLDCFRDWLAVFPAHTRQEAPVEVSPTPKKTRAKAALPVQPVMLDLFG